MDIAAGTVAFMRARGRVATVAVDGMAFHQPVLVGDIVSCYAEVVRVGRTSITMHVEAWAKRGRTGEELKVTEGNSPASPSTRTVGRDRYRRNKHRAQHLSESIILSRHPPMSGRLGLALVGARSMASSDRG